MICAIQIHVLLTYSLSSHFRPAWKKGNGGKSKLERGSGKSKSRSARYYCYFYLYAIHVLVHIISKPSKPEYLDVNIWRRYRQVTSRLICAVAVNVNIEFLKFSYFSDMS